MSKETFVFILGIVVFFVPFLGLPGEYKEWILIGSGLLLIVTGYRLRRMLFLRSLEHHSGERRGDAFVESVMVHEHKMPVHKDSEYTQ
jgi:hypothetical protein